MWFKIWNSKWFQWLVAITLAIIASIIVSSLAMKRIKADIAFGTEQREMIIRRDSISAKEMKNILGVLQTLVTNDSVRNVNQKHLPTFLPLPPQNMTKVSSNYGRRIINGDTVNHTGTDYAALKGTPIFAVATGTVVKANFMNGYGLCTIVDSGNGVIVRYGHQDSIFVKPAQVVAQGQKIGTVGNTGNAFGNHLHIEISVYNKSINPAQFIQL